MVPRQWLAGSWVDYCVSEGTGMDRGLKHRGMASQRWGLCGCSSAGLGKSSKSLTPLWYLLGNWGSLG
jgi:hypothetical protein